jgi:hypothetical protein
MSGIDDGAPADAAGSGAMGDSVASNPLTGVNTRPPFARFLLAGLDVVARAALARSEAASLDGRGDPRGDAPAPRSLCGTRGV